MTSYLIDLNVWLALSWQLHPHSVPAIAWFESLSEKNLRVLFCRITQLGLLRLLTNQMVMGESVLSLEEAWGVLDAWTSDPRVELAGEHKGLEAVFRTMTGAFGKQAATKTVMDAYLAGFAKAEQATLVTFDRALAKNAQRSGAACHLLSFA